ncbi:hypothetical protein [Allokutzneria oryzae]|uniref:Uncharacterized protein n=1 Tax=Allokutzneria oryzae TaxID=1378989 RepID=A0ABV6A4R5_9PSEU
MHRSWFRTKLVEKREQVTSKVKEGVKQRAKSLVPAQLTKKPESMDKCMVCGKSLKRSTAISGDGRVCSPACAHAWVRDLK